MWWDTTSLVQRVNTVCAKKVYYCNRPKYFFLCVNSRITSNIFKTCFGQSEQVWMDEKLITILHFEIQSSAFVFLNLLPFRIMICRFLLAIAFRLVCINLSFASRDFVCPRMTSIRIFRFCPSAWTPRFQRVGLCTASAWTTLTVSAVAPS